MSFIKLLTLFVYLCIADGQFIPHGSREIRVVGPSFQVTNQNGFYSAVARGKADFAKVEYTSYIESNGVLSRWRDYYPCTPQERAIDLSDAIFNDTTKSIIWAVRGGRNAAEVFEYFPIDKNNDINRPLYLFGFSDITSLHYYFSNYYSNIKTIHSLNFNGIASASEAINYLLVKDIMDGKLTKIVDIQALNVLAANTAKLDDTTVLGGNLALTQRSLKTKWQPNFVNKIVVLEEVGETPETVDIWLNQAKANGIFNGAKAIIFGQVYNTIIGNKAVETKTVLSELQDLVDYYNSKKYFSLSIDLSGNPLSGVTTYTYDQLQNKIGVEALPAEIQDKLTLVFDSNDAVTRLEAALLQFYQSKYISSDVKITIVFNNVKNENEKKRFVKEERTIDSVLRDFAAKINIPVFKSEAFGHRSYNLPVPFGTPATLYSERLTGCQGSCSGFILEVNSPFPKFN